MKKESKFYSILKGKCPRCHEGDMFENKNPYYLKKTMAMHNECQVCGQKFNPEPGFYFGAMYVSYGIGVALFVATWVAILILAPASHPAVIFAWVLVVVFLLAPISFRLSRKIWINLFIKYEGDSLKSQKENGIIQ